jgi:hypothetical protein
MEIHFFSHAYKGFIITGNDFELWLSARSLVVLASVALVVVALRRVKKVRGL